MGHAQARAAQGLDRGDRGPARGDNILDETDKLARLEPALDAIPGPVLLRLLADDHERQAARERGSRCERDRAELRSGDAHGVRLTLGHGGCDRLADRGEEAGCGAEAKLVEVVRAALAGAQEEVALEVGGVADRSRQVGHDSTEWISSWASERRRAPSGAPSAIETIEPSSP